LVGPSVGLVTIVKFFIPIKPTPDWGKQLQIQLFPPNVQIPHLEKNNQVSEIPD